MKAIMQELHGEVSGVIDAEGKNSEEVMKWLHEVLRKKQILVAVTTSRNEEKKKLMRRTKKTEREKKTSRTILSWFQPYFAFPVFFLRAGRLEMRMSSRRTRERNDPKARLANPFPPLCQI